MTTPCCVTAEVSLAVSPLLSILHLPTGQGRLLNPKLTSFLLPKSLHS